MHLTAEQTSALSEETFRNFVALGLPEGVYLDYKVALSGSSDKESKREFLKDITAFANAAGGHLLLGVKEPAEGLSVEAQIVGLADAEAIAQDLERVASTSIDPRIPGLRIVRVPVGQGQSCIAVYVPPSLGRPHMVNHAGHRSFYIRHSESSVPMTTHELREAVLTSASAEGRARRLVTDRLQRIRGELASTKAALSLQAVPLIPPEAQWDVFSEKFDQVLRGSQRRGKFRDYATLATGVAPRPTIDGLSAQDTHDKPTWLTEVHRTGLVTLLYEDIQRHKVGDVERFIVHSGTCDVFKAFCHLLKEALDAAGTDVPYLISCVFLGAKGTCFYLESRWERRFSDPYSRDEIVWPEHLRQTGTDPQHIGELLTKELFNAFGYKDVLE